MYAETIYVSVYGYADEYSYEHVSPPAGRTGYWSRVVMYGEDVDVEIWGPGSQTSYDFLYYQSETRYFTNNTGGLLDVDIWSYDYYSPAYYHLTFEFEASANSPPSAKVLMDQPSGLYYEGDTLVFTAFPSDPDGSISKVDFFRDGIKVATDTQSPYKYSYYDATPTGSGELYAVAYDQAGSEGPSNILSFAVLPLENNPEVKYNSWVEDVNGDGYLEEVVDVVVNRLDSFDFSIPKAGLFSGNAKLSMHAEYDYYCYANYYYWWPDFYDFELFDGFYFPGFYYYDYDCEIWLDHLFARITVANAVQGEQYAIQSRHATQDAWQNEVAGLVAGAFGLDVSVGYWWDLFEIPHYFRILKLSKPPAVLSSPLQGNYLESGGEEHLQVVQVSIGEPIEGIYTVEIPHGTPPVNGGVAAVLYPKGSVPTIANIKILAIELGVTASGQLTVSFPASLIGVPSDVEFAVIFFEIEPIRVEVDDTDPETYKVHSVLEETLLTHFVTARQQGQIALRVHGLTQQQGANLAWETSDTLVNLTVDQTDKRKATLTSDFEIGRKVPIQLKRSGETIRDLVVWIVSANSVERSFTLLASSHDDHYFNALARAEILWEIHPEEIISGSDIPDLKDNYENIAPPPSMPVEYQGWISNCGDPLYDGASLKNGAIQNWDVSRQIRARFTDPFGFIPYNEKFQLSGEIYPKDEPDFDGVLHPMMGDIVGNDDFFPYSREEDTYPYEPQTGLFAIFSTNVGEGLLRSHDKPGIRARRSSGSIGDTYSIHLQAIEFVRLYLGDGNEGEWFRISNFEPWSFNMSVRKSGHSIWETVDGEHSGALDNENW